MVNGQWSMVNGQWSMVNGALISQNTHLVFYGLWSTVNGEQHLSTKVLFSMDYGPWTMDYKDTSQTIQASLNFWHRRCHVSYMHTNFNFSFLYPVTQVLPDTQRNGGVQYVHVTDLLINGTATKRHMASSETGESFAFEIEEILAENENIFHMLEEANGLEAIKAACLHHVKQASYGQRADYRMSYLPLKRAI